MKSKFFYSLDTLAFTWSSSGSGSEDRTFAREATRSDTPSLPSTPLRDQSSSVMQRATCPVASTPPVAAVAALPLFSTST